MCILPNDRDKVEIWKALPYTRVILLSTGFYTIPRIDEVDAPEDGSISPHQQVPQDPYFRTPFVWNGIGILGN
mgnify:CR=1 FL=1